MNKENWEEYRELQNFGWNVSKTNQVEFNSGSESVKHAVAKMLVAKAGIEAGYRVSSEVMHQGRGEIDVLLFGKEGRFTLAVECETNPDDETKKDKLSRYVEGTPIDDMALIDIDSLPDDMLLAFNEVKQRLGL